MVLNEYLDEYPKKVEQELKIFFEKKKKEAFDEKVKEIIEIIEEYTLRGGKRLRPVLMIVGYKLFGGKDENEIIKASASIELIQSYLLIHDDIIDESDLRRGKPTLHKIYEKKYEDKKFGENMAIIAGDLASVYAQEILDQTNFPIERKYRALIKMAEIVEETGYGQVLDVTSSHRKNFGEEELLLLHTYKTAKYTLEGPLIMGAILAGHDDFSMISEYSIPVGVAFQLQDDILGLYGTEDKIGKPVTSDLEEGKKTLLILKAIENKNYRDYILNVLGKKNITMEELENVRKFVKSSGALDYTYSLAKDLVSRGVKSLEPIDNEEKLFLKEFADYVIKRNF
ncbi:MAG: polyprenyl synthetase family protein [Thermoplasmata archaeon]|nr:polyprenyl synthetase family protein [Thermoplasmata archaeon]